MRKTIFVSLIALIFGVGCLAYAQSKPNNSAVGAWAGSWSGNSTGKFEMAITKGADGKLSATVTSHPDQGEGSTFQSKLVETNGAKLTIKFEDSNGEIDGTLQAVIDGSSMKGDYSIRAKASGEETDKGTFTAARK